MRFILILTLTVFLSNSCKRGCKDNKACNYDSKAKLKGTCSYDPDNVRTITLRRSFSSSNECYGLDFNTGEITTSAIMVDGLFYYSLWENYSMFTIAGGEGMYDRGIVGGLCEIKKENSGTNVYPFVKESNHGYLVHINATGKYARVYVEDILVLNDRIQIKYEYPF